jgi:catechol 2,3-dioxygenase-like lactoylglutathione lyase family enzyme
MTFGGVHHVSINVGDVEAAGQFYVDVLDMERLPRPDFGFPGMWLRCGDQEIHLIQVDGHVAPRGQHFALRVDDIEAASQQLRDKGVEVSAVIDIPGAGRQVFLHDPAGNMIELNQPAVRA